MYEVEGEEEKKNSKDRALVDWNKNYSKVIRLLRDIRETTNTMSNDKKTNPKGHWVEEDERGRQRHG